MSFNKKFLDVICHRKPERSFKLASKYSILCARCSSMFIGTFLTFLLLVVFKTMQEFNYFILFFFIPLILDGATQLLGLRKSSNILRYFTGWFAGIAAGVLAYGLIFVFWFGEKLSLASSNILLVSMMLGALVYTMLLKYKKQEWFEKFFNKLSIISLYSTTLLVFFLTVSFAIWII